MATARPVRVPVQEADRVLARLVPWAVVVAVVMAQDLPDMPEGLAELTLPWVAPMALAVGQAVQET